MRTLDFSFEGQKLTKNGDFSNIILGSKGYLRCHFSFEGSEYIGSKIVAVFEVAGIEYFAPVDSRGYCMVPDDVTDSKYFRVKIIIAKGTTRIPTNKVLVEQKEA